MLPDDNHLDTRPYRDIVTGKTIKGSNPLNKKEVDAFEVDEFLNGIYETNEEIYK